MFCRECGKELIADSKFCPYCGTKIIKLSELQEIPSFHSNITPDTNTNIHSINKEEYERLHQIYMNKSNEELLEMINQKNEYTNTAILTASDILRNERGIIDGLPNRESLLVNEQKQSSIQNTPYNIMCILGLVISCISLFINFWGIVGIAGVILSIIGLLQSHNKQENGNILAIIGIIIGIYSIFYAFTTLMNLSSYIHL